MPEVCLVRQARSVQMPAGVVCLPAAHLAFAFDAHFERAVGTVRGARIGIVAQAILRAELPVYAVEHFTEFADCVREISRAARRIRNRLERVLSRRIAAT